MLAIACVSAIVASLLGSGAAGPIAFDDATARTGVAFTLANSAGGPRKHIIETMVGGLGVFDYDNDGRLDVYFANGARIPSLQKDDPRFFNRLFHQEAEGRFVDVTEKAGVAGTGYSMGVAIADYDNDGHSDLFVPGLNHSTLYRNRADGTFEDVTARAGLGGDQVQARWAVAAGWFDYDNDGLLDLFIVRYLQWDPARERTCPNPSAPYRLYCDPKYYDGLPNALFRNNGDGTFADVSDVTGIGAHVGKGMSVAFADYDADGRMDAFVANDTVPNFVFHNEGKRFTEAGLTTGVSVNDTGRPISSMGIVAGDYDQDGLDDVFVTALALQTFPLWRNLGDGMFEDVTRKAGMAAPSTSRSGWGAGLFDFDNDGRKDIFVANGDVQDNTEVYSSRASRQPNLVIRQTRAGVFEDVTSGAGQAVANAAFHRGAAFGDLDGDGRVDAVVSRLNEPAVVFRNTSGGHAHWLRVRPVGSRSNRDGIGARIHIVSASGREQWNTVTTAVGYASASEAVAHFGLGEETTVRKVDILWPSGTRQRLTDVRADQVLVVREPPE